MCRKRHIPVPGEKSRTKEASVPPKGRHAADVALRLEKGRPWLQGQRL